MLTIMGIKARDAGLDITGISLKTTKVMASAPRRVSELQVEFEMPEKDFTQDERNLLETAALTCPVALSLHPDLKQSVVFNWK